MQLFYFFLLKFCYIYVIMYLIIKPKIDKIKISIFLTFVLVFIGKHNINVIILCCCLFVDYN